MKRQTSPYAPLSGAVMLIGIIALIVVPGLHFWPWILAVLGLASLPYGIHSGGLIGGLLSSAVLVALAIIIDTEFWPGCLLLLVAAMLIGTFIRARRRK